MKVVRAERRRNASGVVVERGCEKLSALGSGWCVTRISYFQKADMFSPCVHREPLAGNEVYVSLDARAATSS